MSTIFCYQILGFNMWNSVFDLSKNGVQYSPFDERSLLVDISSNSLITCTRQCLSISRCRTMNFNSQTKDCRLYEGDSGTTGLIISSVSPIIYGKLVLKPQNYLNYGLSCSFCQRNRYLICTNNSTCQCHIHEYFDGYVCRSQKYNGSSCVTNVECRQDLNLTCGSTMQCELKTYLLTSTNETVYGIWSTDAGKNSSAASEGLLPGNYDSDESPPKCFDQNTTTKYLSYGNCWDVSVPAANCGLRTGFYITPIRGLSILRTFRFGTGQDYPERDPLIITIECSNQTVPINLNLGSNWILIYNGSTGLDTNPGRNSYGVKQYISKNSWCRSYRLLVTSKRGNSNSVQYSEVEFMGQ